MAFGFLKKIAAALTGGGKKQPQQPGGGKKSRRRGNKGHGKQQPGGQKPSPEGSSHGAKKGGQPQRQQQNPKKQQPQAQQQRDGKGRDRDRGRGGRRGDRRHRGGDVPVNTAADAMRPGGEISAEELAARKAAHAKWNPSSFVVEPVEGKKRFHDFDLPGEVMHGIADLGFKYCTEIQALSLEQALAGKNIAGKAQTGSGKTTSFLFAILTRNLRTTDNMAKIG